PDVVPVAPPEVCATAKPADTRTMADAVTSPLIMVVSFRLLGVVSHLLATATEQEVPVIVPLETATGTRSGPRSFGNTRRSEMKLVQIFLPCADNNGHSFPTANLQEVMHDLVVHYRGLPHTCRRRRRAYGGRLGCECRTRQHRHLRSHGRE